MRIEASLSPEIREWTSLLILGKGRRVIPTILELLCTGNGAASLSVGLLSPTGLWSRTFDFQEPKERIRGPFSARDTVHILINAS